MGDLKNGLSKALDIAIPDTSTSTTMPAYVPSEIVRRSELHALNDGYVEMTLPIMTRLVRSEHVGRNYLQAILSVKGGRLYAYVYGDTVGRLDYALRKHEKAVKVIVSFKICEKDDDNGRVSTYLDCQLAPEGTKATHRLLVHGVAPPNKKPETVFSIPVANSEGEIEIRTLPTRSELIAA